MRGMLLRDRVIRASAAVTVGVLEAGSRSGGDGCGGCGLEAGNGRLQRERSREEGRRGRRTPRRRYRSWRTIFDAAAGGIGLLVIEVAALLLQEIDSLADGGVAKLDLGDDDAVELVGDVLGVPDIGGAVVELLGVL